MKDQLCGKPLELCGKPLCLKAKYFKAGIIGRFWGSRYEAYDISLNQHLLRAKIAIQLKF